MILAGFRYNFTLLRSPLESEAGGGELAFGGDPFGLPASLDMIDRRIKLEGAVSS
jgi:hypothetical protein